MKRETIPVPRVGDKQLEAGVLGRVISYQDAYAKIADVLQPDLFTDMQHRRLCEAILDIRREGYTPDVQNIVNHVAKKHGDEKKAATLFLMDVIEAGHSTYDLERATLLLREKYIRNRLYQLGHRLLFDDGDALDLLEKATGEVSEIQAGAVGESSRHIHDVAEDAVKEMEEAVASRQRNETPANAVPTGFRDLDAMFSGGWRAGELVLLAGRPAMGKTAEALNIAANVGRRLPVLFFSLEMRDVELANRIICSHGEIDGRKVRLGDLQGHEIMGYAESANHTGALDVLIEQRANKLNQIIGISKRWRLRTKQDRPGLIVVDYLQLIDSEVKGKSTNDQMGAISRALKLMAIDLNCVVLALSQLSRAVETRGGDKRPILSDLRDSGNLEQDADSVVFTYRPEYYGFETDSEGNSSQGLCENIIAKNRHGITGPVDLQFISKWGKFSDWGGGFAPSDYVPF